MINKEQSDDLLKSETKHEAFKQWLLANGAEFDSDVIYPAVFSNGLIGLAAKREIAPNKAFIKIPAYCIISIDRAKNCKELAPIFKNNIKLFSKLHPDYVQLTLAVFIMFEKKKGLKSFWHPYLQVMNKAELLQDWTETQLEQLGDKIL